jgi:hypothetical protein
MKLTAKLGYVATTGGHNVATYTLPKQANRAVLHSHRAIHDDPRTSHLETVIVLLQNPSMTLILGVITLAAGLAMVLAHNIWSGGVRSSSWSPSSVGWRLSRAYSSCSCRMRWKQDFFFSNFTINNSSTYSAISLVLGVYLTYGGFRSRSN